MPVAVVKLAREMADDAAPVGYLPDEETIASKVATLLAHQQRLASGEVNPYQGRFFNFLTRCVWTIDEAKAGLVRKFPSGLGADGRSWDTLWLEEEHYYLTEKLLFVEKSRRVLASWLTCAYDVWLCAGGQDPRWTDESSVPVLMGSTRNRQVILAARKAEGFTGSSWFIESRIKTILEQFELQGCRRYWPDFPEWEHKQGQIDFSTGGRISGVPQGSDQLRGGAATLIHGEEVAFWEMAASAIGGAIPTMRGGGHMILVTTANVGSYAQAIRDGKLKKER